MAQVEAWLLSGDVQRLVVVVSGVDSGETLERWQFNVSLEENDEENTLPNSQAPGKQKTLKEIHGEIQAIIRQVTASVTFLPLLNEPCSFDLLVYTKKDAAIPAKWEDSDPRYIMNSQEVKLRSFTTSVGDQSIFFYFFLFVIVSHPTLYLNPRFIRLIPWWPIGRLMNGNSNNHLIGDIKILCIQKRNQCKIQIVSKKEHILTTQWVQTFRPPSHQRWKMIFTRSLLI